MEATVEAVYRKEILKQFIKAYHLDETYKLLGDFENYVYAVTRKEKSYILRVTHSSHRSEEEIYGEINWIAYLKNNGANVPVIFPSANNSLVEKQSAKDSSVFYACLFSKVSGNPIRPSDEAFNDTLFESWGREIGKMHRITADYQPEFSSRKKWMEDDLFEIEKYVPDEATVINRTKEMVKRLRKLPQHNYGLIHNDVHFGNFFYDGREIHVFDFDDACYFWHVSDIAIPLYYSCYALFSERSTKEEKEVFADQFLSSFMNGYCHEMKPPEKWKELVPLFLKVRDITLYAALNKKIAPSDRDERLQNRMKQLKERIERDEAIVSIS